MAMSHKLDSDIQQSAQNKIIKYFILFFMIIRLSEWGLKISSFHRTQNILTFNKQNVYSILHLQLQSRFCIFFKRRSTMTPRLDQVPMLCSSCARFIVLCLHICLLLSPVFFIRIKPDSSPVLRSGPETSQVPKKCLPNKFKKLFGIIFSLVITG